MIALGAGIVLSRWSTVIEKPLTLDLAAQWQELTPRSTRKATDFVPGASFSSGGRLVQLAFTLGARF